MQEFLAHVKEGLSKYPKSLSSRYFYDAKGDELFQQIMQLDEYYLPNCEMDIINHQSQNIAQEIAKQHSALQVVELGAGDGSKTKFLLHAFTPHFQKINYWGLDISDHVLELNKQEITQHAPEIQHHRIGGNYFNTYTEVPPAHTGKLVLFLGANIGNYFPDAALEFFNFVTKRLSPNDFFLVAFDMVKHPRKIIRAYDDCQGITKAFNLNLLRRMNQELKTDFNLEKFDHFPYYNPINGITSSQLISLEEQEVRFPDGTRIHFEPYEAIHTEISKKYFWSDIINLSKQSNLNIHASYFDQQKEYTFVLFNKPA